MQERNGCLTAIFRFFLNLFGLGTTKIRQTTEPIDQRYREFVDVWVSENLARWLHETRSEIDTAQATKVLIGEAERYPEVAAMIRETLIAAKVTFLQREGQQYLEIG